MCVRALVIDWLIDWLIDWYSSVGTVQHIDRFVPAPSRSLGQSDGRREPDHRRPSSLKKKQRRAKFDKGVCECGNNSAAFIPAKILSGVQALTRIFRPRRRPIMHCTFFPSFCTYSRLQHWPGSGATNKKTTRADPLKHRIMSGEFESFAKMSRNRCHMLSMLREVMLREVIYQFKFCSQESTYEK